MNWIEESEENHRKKTENESNERIKKQTFEQCFDTCKEVIVRIPNGDSPVKINFFLDGCFISHTDVELHTENGQSFYVESFFKVKQEGIHHEAIFYVTNGVIKDNSNYTQYPNIVEYYTFSISNEQLKDISIDDWIIIIGWLKSKITSEHLIRILKKYGLSPIVDPLKIGRRDKGCLVFVSVLTLASIAILMSYYIFL